MNIIKSRENWTEGAKELHMRQFLYRAKYGEYKDRKIAWITRYEQEWKALNNIVYMDNNVHARTESSFHRFLVTKKNETVKMFSRAEVKITKGKMVRDRHHKTTDDYWEVLPGRIYHGAGILVQIKTGLEPEHLQRALAAIGLRTQDIEAEDHLPGNQPVTEEPAENEIEQVIGKDDTPVQPDWRKDLQHSLHVARGLAPVREIIEECRKELVINRGGGDMSESEAAESSETSGYARTSNTTSDGEFEANSTEDDLCEVSVEGTYMEYKKKLADADPRNQDHIIHVLGVMNQLRKQPMHMTKSNLMEEEASESTSEKTSESDSKTASKSKSPDPNQQFKQPKLMEEGASESDTEEVSESKSPETKQQFKQVSSKTPLRMCPNFKLCKYCLCHNCFERMVQEEQDSTKMPASPLNQRKNHRKETTPPGGRRKRTRGKEETVHCDHKHLSMLVLEENVLYFRKAYVTRKGADYDYPTSCSRCKESLLVEI
jgi:hypothetical protein